MNEERYSLNMVVASSELSLLVVAAVVAAAAIAVVARYVVTSSCRVCRPVNCDCSTCGGADGV